MSWAKHKSATGLDQEAALPRAWLPPTCCAVPGCGRQAVRTMRINGSEFVAHVCVLKDHQAKVQGASIESLRPNSVKKQKPEIGAP
jgi:hypothetical protein